MTPKGTTLVLLNVAAQALFFLMSGSASSTGCEAWGILEHGPCQDLQKHIKYMREQPCCTMQMMMQAQPEIHPSALVWLHAVSFE